MIGKGGGTSGGKGGGTSGVWGGGGVDGPKKIYLFKVELIKITWNTCAWFFASH